MLLLVPDFMAILLHEESPDLFIRYLCNGIQDYLKNFACRPPNPVLPAILIGIYDKVQNQQLLALWEGIFLFSFMELYCIITVVLKNGDRVYVI